MPFTVSHASNYASRRIYIALGANQSYRRTSPIENLKCALQQIASSGVSIRACSKPWRTPAWPNPEEPPFVNAVAEIETGLNPEGLLGTLHQIEAELGRIRTTRNAPRTIDLDLIDYRAVMIQPKSHHALQLPHPRAHERAFVLLPMRDIAPHWVDPLTGLTVYQLLSRLSWAERKACRPAGGMLWAAR